MTYIYTFDDERTRKVIAVRHYANDKAAVAAGRRLFAAWTTDCNDQLAIHQGELDYDGEADGRFVGMVEYNALGSAVRCNTYA